MGNTGVMDLRPYVPADRETCLQIYDSNSLPVAGRAEFVSFLEGLPAQFLVMEHDSAVIGCGGYQIDAEAALASLVWGMVRRDSQRMGLGRYLLMYRLREIGKVGGIERVRLETLREYAAFFEGQGFKVVGTGDSRVEMVKRLTVCA
jgi:N-acetylglutamate synthase-like GNAT family acetyltransferase